MPNVLIGPGHLRHQPGSFREILAAAGFQFIEPAGDHMLTEADLRAALPEADAIIAGGEQIHAGLLALAPRLRAIARTGVGYDAVDVEAATARSIPVVITPGTNQGSVAEQTFALVLALARNVIGNDRTIRAGGWDRTLVQPLRGKTLGLVGLGRIGRAVASRARRSRCAWSRSTLSPLPPMTISRPAMASRGSSSMPCWPPPIL